MDGITRPDTSALLHDARDHGSGLAVVLIAQLVVVLGPGNHTVTCAAVHPGGILRGSLEIEIGEHGVSFVGGPSSMLVSALAHALMSGESAGIVTRSHDYEGDRDIVRGWLIVDGRPEPLTAEQVKTAYASGSPTDEPLPSERDTVYRPSIPLADLDSSDGEEESDDGSLRPR